MMRIRMGTSQWRASLRTRACGTMQRPLQTIDYSTYFIFLSLEHQMRDTSLLILKSSSKTATELLLVCFFPSWQDGGTFSTR